MKKGEDLTKQDLIKTIEESKDSAYVEAILMFPKYQRFETDEEIKGLIEKRVEELTKIEEFEINSKKENTLSEEIRSSSDNPFDLVEKVTSGKERVVSDAVLGHGKTTADVYRNYLRFWSPALGEYELKFMNYLFEKISGYEKDGDYIPTEQMINGTIKIENENGVKKKVRVDWGTGIAVGKSYKAREAIHYRTCSKLESLGLIKVRRGTKANPKDRYPTNHYRFNIKKDLMTWDNVKPFTEKDEDVK